MIPSDAEVVPVEGVFRTGKYRHLLDASLEQTRKQLYWVSAAGNNQKIRGKTVLVAGATGGVGSQVVQCLCNEGAKVRALVRDYTKVVWPFNLLVLLLGTSKCLSRLTLVTLVFACVTGLEVSMNSRCVVLCRTRICTHRTWRFSRAMSTST